MLAGDFKFYEAIVNRLIMQYKEYLHLSGNIQNLENRRFKMLGDFANEHNLSLPQASKSKLYKNKFKNIDMSISLAKTDLQRLSDEMTYSNHYIWMMYKDKAYKGTSTEMSTLADFKRHCSPEDYICTTRYKFLRSYLIEHSGIDIDDEKLFSSNTKLSDFYNTKELTDLLDDLDFLQQWKRNEYLISNDQINKWHTKTT